MYKLTIAYDGVEVATWNYPDVLSAVHNFDKCVDFGGALEYATYNLSEPTGKMHTKTFYRNGEVTVK